METLEQDNLDTDKFSKFICRFNHKMDHKESNAHYNKNLQPLAKTLRNTMTKGEACAWKYILRAGMMKGYTFRRQRPVGEYIADFMCKDLNLIIEIDGLTHNSTDTEMKDAQRDTRLEELGFTILRFTTDEVLNHIDGVRNTIELWIEQREPSTPLPPPAGDM